MMAKGQDGPEPDIFDVALKGHLCGNNIMIGVIYQEAVAATPQWIGRLAAYI